ncbi:TOBE domain-containing protein [Agromyces luteolus]|uniref:TOBE domain-containing protein n=1 Tax=Agromyces luteolus TaxID=88373 RepID=A0A7C9HK35_9MICO|nr:TOBE domain-containing protein [Agromyces luteolus]MUN08961.1 TOBE domain-containing protein [Agromyces luteolus]
MATVVQESTFLGSVRRTLLRTEGGELLRMQHPVGERAEFGERVGVTIDEVPVAVREVA